MKTMTSLTLLVGGVLAIGGCAHHAKPVSSTTTHTDTTTESNTGDRQHDRNQHAAARWNGNHQHHGEHPAVDSTAAAGLDSFEVAPPPAGR